MGFSLSEALGALLATISGVIVAFLTHYLDLGREAARERRLQSNTRALLALEIHSNRAALSVFWRTITALAAPISGDSDEPSTPEQPAQPGSSEELAGMFKHGLVGYNAPTWSTIRWNNIEPSTVGALTPGDVATLDSMYRTLQNISSLYSRIATLTPEDEAVLRKNMGGRFWFNEIARDRVDLYSRLRAAVSQVLDAPDPLPGAIQTADK